LSGKKFESKSLAKIRRRLLVHQRYILTNRGTKFPGVLLTRAQQNLRKPLPSPKTMMMMQRMKMNQNLKIAMDWIMIG